MVPMVELRGSIPIAIGAELGLPEWLAFILAVVGNLIPIPFVFFFARKFLEWGAKKKWKPLKQFCNFCLKKGEKGGKKLLKKTGNYGTYFALFLFVAIPLPGTGAWTGALAASILNLDFKKTIIAIIPGILVAGAIVLAISKGLFNVILGIGQ